MARELTAEAEAALALAADVCSKMTDRDELMDERRSVWTAAFDAGATYDAIAETCGVSTHLVRLEVSKAKERPWATGTEG